MNRAEIIRADEITAKIAAAKLLGIELIFELIYQGDKVRVEPSLVDKEVRFKAYCDLDRIGYMANQINVAQVMCLVLPDYENTVIYGYMQSYEPDTIVEGEMPTANVGITIITREEPE